MAHGESVSCTATILGTTRAQVPSMSIKMGKKAHSFLLTLSQESLRTLSVEELKLPVGGATAPTTPQSQGARCGTATC